MDDDPFVLAERDGRLYGRGTTDMKGFLACALHAALARRGQPLASPLHLALSWDEEIGCVGVRTLLPAMDRPPRRPRLLHRRRADGDDRRHRPQGQDRRPRHLHRPRRPFGARPAGAQRHPPRQRLRRRAPRPPGGARGRGRRDPGYAVPYTTLHAGRIEGGVALNIVPNRCTVDFEIRNLAADDPAASSTASAPTPTASPPPSAPASPRRDRHRRDQRLSRPRHRPASQVVALVRGLAGTGTGKVAYGTEAGLFVETLGIPTVVCGPGDMAQGHRPDEFVAEAELAACDAMLDRLLARLAAGL